MTSPAVLVNGSSTTNGVNVSPGATVTIALENIDGVSSWNLSCFGTDDLNSASAINETLVINQTNKTATFTMPDGYGTAAVFQSIVNNAIDDSGNINTSYSTTFGVYVLTSNYGLRVAAQNETNEGNVEYGWLRTFNFMTSASVPGPRGPVGEIGTNTQFIAAGDLSGTDTDQIVSKIGGITITGTPSIGQAITATSSSAASWQNVSGYVIGSYGVYGRPTDICFDGTNIWTASPSGYVTAMVASTGEYIAAYATGYSPYGICFDGTNIWTANQSNNSVTKISTSGSIIGTYSCGTGPTRICAAGSYVWTANYGTSTLTKIDISSGATAHTTAGVSSYSVCYGGGYIWAPNYGSNWVSKINAFTGSIITDIGDSGWIENPYALCSDGTYIWVTSYADTLVKIRISDGSIMATAYTSAFPSAVCSDGTNIWVTNQNGNTVSKFSGSTGALIKNYAVGSTPDAICFDGNCVWIANYGNGTVTKMLV